jgi:Arc/MetJ-type ribon-helix-helix transcriptional regulator
MTTQQHQGLKLITIHLPEAYLQGIAELIKSQLYPNRSEAIRIAVRDLLKSELWETKTSHEPTFSAERSRDIRPRTCETQVFPSENRIQSASKASALFGESKHERGLSPRLT